MAINISAICSELRKTAYDSKKEFGGLSAEQLNWKPSEKEWSVAQSFQHLIVTNELYFPNIQSAVDGRHRNNVYSKIPFVTDLISFAMKNSLNPKQSRKMKTFRMFQPSASNLPVTIIDDYVTNQNKLIDLVEASRHLDINRIKIAEPISPALNLRLGNAFEILAMHGERHFLQAKRLLEMDGFPN